MQPFRLSTTPEDKPPGHPFREAVLRGLAVLFPPLLTVLIFVWAINTTQQYFLQPVNAWANEALVWLVADVREDLQESDHAQRTAMVDHRPYYHLDDGTFVPLAVYDRVRRSLSGEPRPQSSQDVYRRYVQLTYLRPYYAIPCFLAIFVLLLYLLGKFMAAGIGDFFGSRFDAAVHRLPLVRSVYSAVKQVTDFFFSEQTMQFTRVVAVEYPRHGMWSLAFVTSEGLKEVGAAANEAVLGIFVPTSPMPMTGYALTVLKREVVDLNLTIDQAIQFIVSCGLVLPTQEMKRLQAAAPEKPRPAEGP